MNISIDENYKELSVYYLPKFNIIGDRLYDAYSLLELILSDLGIKDEALQNWGITIDQSDDNFSQKIDINRFYTDILIGYKKVINAQYPNVDKNEVKRILKQYKDGLNTVTSNLILLSHINIKQIKPIKILRLHVWDILMNNYYAPYLSVSLPIELKVKYIGQAFGKKGSRNVYDRIDDGHEHIQELIATCPETKELAVNFFSLSPKSEMFGKVKDAKLK